MNMEKPKKEEEMPKHSVSLKLLIDTKRACVLFAEAPESLTTLLSDTLSLPVGIVVSFFRQQEKAAGSLENLCKSIENMKINLIAPPAAKTMYYCNGCYITHAYRISTTLQFSDSKRTLCPTCHKCMSGRLEFVASPKEPSHEGGAAANFMITDDLEVMPLSVISIMALLNKFGVKDVSALEEKVVHLGIGEVVKLLNASVQSKKVLTDVFLTPKGIQTDPKGKKVKRERDGDVVNIV